MDQLPPRIGQRKDELGVGGNRIKMEDLAAFKDFIANGVEDAEATVPGRSDKTAGVMLYLTDPETDTDYQCFVGGVALVRELKQLRDKGGFPVMARLIKAADGRTWLME